MYAIIKFASIYMKIDLKDIYDFFELRIACHVRSVNYFASLLGYHFPEHDQDKLQEPFRTGYAYVFYTAYHKNFCLKPEHKELCKQAHDDHHKHSLHHIEYYENVADIPDIRLYEMISDWASANFEQRNIIKAKDSLSLDKWFHNNMSSLPWTEHQTNIILSAFDTLKKQTDTKQIMAIWEPVSESKSDF